MTIKKQTTIIISLITILSGCAQPLQKNNTQSERKYCYSGNRLRMAIIPVCSKMDGDLYTERISNALLHSKSASSRFHIVERVSDTCLSIEPEEILFQEHQLNAAEMFDDPSQLNISLTKFLSILQDRKQKRFKYHQSNLKLIFDEFKRIERNSGKLMSGEFQSAEYMLFVSVIQKNKIFRLSAQLVDLETLEKMSLFEKNILPPLTYPTIKALADLMYQTLKDDLPQVQGTIKNIQGNTVAITFDTPELLKPGMKIELFRTLPASQISQKSHCIPIEKINDARLLEQKNGQWLAEMLTKNNFVKSGDIVLTR